MRLGLKARARDALDAVYLKVMDRPDLPPYTLRCHVGPAIEYEQLPAEYISYFKTLCGVGVSDSILDVGCGTGRFAVATARAPELLPRDVSGFRHRRTRDRVGAHARHHAPHADIRFDHVDLFNEHYNPGATTRAERLCSRMTTRRSTLRSRCRCSRTCLRTPPRTISREVGRILEARRPGAGVVRAPRRRCQIVAGTVAHPLVRGSAGRERSGPRRRAGPGPLELDGYATLTPGYARDRDVLRRDEPPRHGEGRGTRHRSHPLRQLVPARRWSRVPGPRDPAAAGSA